jgi:hypothetical protein
VPAEWDRVRSGQDPKNPSKLIEFGPGSYICGDFVCGPNGRPGIAPCGGCNHDSSGLIFLGAGAIKDAAALGIEAADEAGVSAFEHALRLGSWLNQGQSAQLLGFVHFQSAILGLPRIDRVLLMPCSRATSAAVRPASICFSVPMICASLCLLLLILAPVRNPKIISALCGFKGACQEP